MPIFATTHCPGSCPKHRPSSRSFPGSIRTSSSHDWLADAGPAVAQPVAGLIGSQVYSAEELRSDLDRFMLLLGGCPAAERPGTAGRHSLAGKRGSGQLQAHLTAAAQAPRRIGQPQASHTCLYGGHSGAEAGPSNPPSLLGWYAELAVVWPIRLRAVPRLWLAVPMCVYPDGVFMHELDQLANRDLSIGNVLARQPGIGTLRQSARAGSPHSRSATQGQLDSNVCLG